MTPEEIALIQRAAAGGHAMAKLSLEAMQTRQEHGD